MLARIQNNQPGTAHTGMCKHTYTTSTLAHTQAAMASPTAAAASAAAAAASKGGLRIASFLPAATEMVFQLGLGEYLVGRTHECDSPAEAKDKPVLVDCVLNLEGKTTQEIDDMVAARLREGKSLYHVDEGRLREAAPTLLITQNLCQVCGPSGNEVTQVLKTLQPAPTILWQTPKSFHEVMDAYVELGKHTGKEAEAEAWVALSLQELEALKAKVARHMEGRPPVRVAFFEWIEPVYAAGHWVPEMLEWAGGEDRNARAGKDSLRIPWDDVVAGQPEVVIVSPCGFRLEQAVEQAKILMQRPGFMDLPAAKKNQVYAVDANAHYSRPGIRLVEGVLLLAHILHGADAFPFNGTPDSVQHVPVPGAASDGNGASSTSSEASED